MANRYADWFRQAEADLRHARHALEDGDYSRILDKHYIPTRYPNGFDSGAPADFYTQTEAKDVIRYAEAILEFCRHQIG
ncbi:MAG: DNA-binding protein [Pirellulaceae bacterium]|jgi:HEPN domain-containing protein|uniref:HEPN domain-containing protein n=1 Tax=Caldilinea sp. TaxID=2293560 RepID=UPI0021DD83BA|nr:HEPN domain-containing protein [uncultured Caldilinea sp.]GIW91868.1 MAG: DNA-binding protein [Pirellulaceae bacterium]